MGGLEKCDVGAEVDEGLAALDGFVEAVGMPGVGSRHDEDVGPLLPRIHSSAYSGEGLLALDHLLAPCVAAALGRELILDHRAGEPRRCVAAHGALGIHRVAVARIGIANHGQRNRLADIAALIDHFPVGDEACIGEGEASGAHREAAHESELEARALNQPG